MDSLDSLPHPSINLYSVIGTLALASFIWEHFGRLYKVQCRPSAAISWAADWLVYVFTKIGAFIAYVSSFYTYIKYQDILTTLTDLIVPIWKMTISPFYMIHGYASTVSLYKHPYIVFFGSVTLSVALGYAALAYSGLTVAEAGSLISALVCDHRRGVWVVISLAVSLAVTWFAWV